MHFTINSISLKKTVNQSQSGYFAPGACLLSLNRNNGFTPRKYPKKYQPTTTEPTATSSTARTTTTMQGGLTSWVSGRTGGQNALARPKSAILSVPSRLTRRFCGLRSLLAQPRKKNTHTHTNHQKHNYIANQHELQYKIIEQGTRYMTY